MLSLHLSTQSQLPGPAASLGRLPDAVLGVGIAAAALGALRRRRGGARRQGGAGGAGGCGGDGGEPKDGGGNPGP